jgi:hypothetical protein
MNSQASLGVFLLKLFNSRLIYAVVYCKKVKKTYGLNEKISIPRAGMLIIYF